MEGGSDSDSQSLGWCLFMLLWTRKQIAWAANFLSHSKPGPSFSDLLSSGKSAS